MLNITSADSYAEYDDKTINLNAYKGNCYNKKFNNKYLKV